MDRVAVIADIHGNLPALEAVLADIDKAGPDLIVLNGDLADGPFPRETLDVLTALGDRALWLRGNSDRWLVDARDGRLRRDDETGDLIRWAASQITQSQRDKLAALPLTHAIDVVVLGRLGLCHATARSDNEMILVDSPVEHYRAAFAEIDAATVAVGHCHMPFDRLFDRRRVINVGSVGMPYGHAGASWALIGRDIILRRTIYDRDSAAERIIATAMPGAAEFVRTCVCATSSDREALNVFREVVRRQQETGHFD